MRNLMESEMREFSLVNRGPMTIKETINITTGNLETDGSRESITMFLQPLVIDRSNRSEKIISITGIVLRQSGSDIYPVPMHICFGKGLSIQIHYSSQVIESENDLKMIQDAYRDYERFRRLMGIGGMSTT